jgi:heme-degrading monooxygenase HmoA
MFSVIFEVQPKPERWDDYLALAKRLKPEIETIDGFIDNERFASRRTKGRLLSLSTWRDEKSVVRWRTLGVHHETQEKGRNEIFADYHLRVGEIVADTQLPKGQRIADQRRDETEIGAAKIVTISELTSPQAIEDVPAALGAPAGLVDCEVYDSIYNKGKIAVVAGWRDIGTATAWTPTHPADIAPRHRVVRVIRDYGMRDRREAPQYYPEVKAR